MQECNSPRNSWRKLIKTMRLGAEPELAFAPVLKTEHRIDRFAHALKNSNQVPLSTRPRGGSLEISRFFLPPFHGPPEAE